MSNSLVMHTDGGSRGNPGPSSAGFWIPSLQHYGYRFLGSKTNNEAEYEGLILALEYAIDNGHRRVHIKSDSKLIVNQVNGLWSVKQEHLQKLKDKVEHLVVRLQAFGIEYVPREQNAEADKACNECLDLAADSDATGYKVAA